MAFEPINSQEELDRIIGARLTREKEKYADYDDLKIQLGQANEKITAYEKTINGHKQEMDGLNAKIAEADKKIKEFETDALKTKVTVDSGLPLELRGYLRGETEEEIKASAAELGKFTARNSMIPPMGDPEKDPPKDEKQAAIRGVLQNLRGE